MKKLTLILVLLTSGILSYGATNTAKATGNWNAASTWSLNRTPQTGDGVVIPSGIVVVVNSNENSAMNLAIQVFGYLYINGGSMVLGKGSAIWVYSGGYIFTNGAASETLKVTTTTLLNAATPYVVGPTKMLASAATPAFGAFNPLPVKFVDFTANRAENNVQLKWSTAEEMNSEMYEVQRSFDGTNFSTIGYVAGAGNSTVTNNYAFSDKNVIANTVHYRIKQIDQDGQYTYTSIKTIRSEATTATAVRIGGNNGKVFMQFGGAQITGKVMMSIISLNGQVLSQQVLSSATGQQVIDVRLKGNYIVSLSNGQDFKSASQVIL